MKDRRYWMKNPIWKGQQLGTSLLNTIGTAGCLECSATRMVAKRAGLGLTPYDLNKALVEVGGYVGGDNLRFAAITELFPEIRFQFLWDYSDKPFSLDDAQACFDLWQTGYAEFLVQVDYKLTVAGLQQHWLHLDHISPEPGWRSEYRDWICYDPLYGELVRINSRYAKYGRDLDYSVWRMVNYVPADVFVGPRETVTGIVWPISDDVSSKMPLSPRVLWHALTGGRRGREK